MKFKRNKEAEQQIISQFQKLKGLPSKTKFTANDNMIRQKMQFDAVMAKYEDKEKKFKEEPDYEDSPGRYGSPQASKTFDG